MSFEVKLSLFEGPFDLLLFFIERDELDIHDIPISKITDDFLSYIRELEAMNIEVASEFILVAATLMRIKAKMLLPRPVLNEEGEEIDPREELVKHLLEYKRYKSVIKELAEMEEERAVKHERGNLVQEIKKLSESNNVEAELQDVTLYKLLKVFERVTQRFEMKQKEQPHRVVQYPYTISGQKGYILSSLKDRKRLSFQDVIMDDPNKIAVIFNFLAILELLQLGDISLQLGEGYNNFWVIRTEEAEVRAQ
ncbi:MAG: segregation and condensation protein A [Cyclobacteriaceae bacterium]